MSEVRTILAAVLGIGLGILLVASPETVIRAHTAGRLPSDRGGNYGEEAPPPERWRRLVQAVGVGVLLLGGYFGATAIGL